MTTPEETPPELIPEEILGEAPLEVDEEPPDLTQLTLRCAVCKTTEMIFFSLEPDLPAYQCETCGSVWIASTHYWEWLDQHKTMLPEAPELDASLAQAIEDNHAHQCPWDHHILIRYDIGNGVDFSLEQCGHCNSFWLDHHKWKVLKSRNLHLKLHKIRSHQWQHQIWKEKSRMLWQEIYLKKFGEADYAEVQRIKIWLDQHPQRQQLLDYLAREDPYDM